MRRTTLAIALFFPLSIAACGDTMNRYTKAEVEILSISRTTLDSTEIVYRPILDTLYHCPGANTHNDAGRRKISFARCKIGEPCAVDIKAEKLPPNQWKIIVHAPRDTIDLIFRDGEVRADTVAP